MSVDAILWIKLAHFIGFIAWVGSMFALASMMREPAGGSEEGRRLLVALTRRAGRAMDIGATLAIAAGVILLIKSPEPRPVKQPYFHVKLALVVGLIALHGFLRARAGKLAKGDSRSLGPAPLALAALISVGILAMMVVGPLYLHK
jgi:putative membrane protein